MENGMRPRSKKKRYLSFSRSIAALLCLLVTHADSSPFANETTVTAVELLTAYSGESAKQYEPYFRFSEETGIVGVEIHAVGTRKSRMRALRNFTRDSRFVKPGDRSPSVRLVRTA